MLVKIKCKDLYRILKILAIFFRNASNQELEEVFGTYDLNEIFDTAAESNESFTNAIIYDKIKNYIVDKEENRILDEYIKNHS